MEDLKDYIEDRLKEIEEIYDFYLTKLDSTFVDSELRQYEYRLRELRVEKRILEDIIDKIGEIDENMVSN